MRFPQPCWMLQSVRHGGYSSAAERLTVAQDVVGSIPTSRPKYNFNIINNLQIRPFQLC